jgi:hypothetical protein
MGEKERKGRGRRSEFGGRRQSKTHQVIIDPQRAVHERAEEEEAAGPSLCVRASTALDIRMRREQERTDRWT